VASAFILALASLGGCSGASSGSDAGPVPPVANTGGSAPLTFTSSSGATATVTIGSIPEHQGPRRRLEGYGEVTITVTAADGSTRTWCLLLANTDPLRRQGLMYVEDPTLGGYDGMLFTFSGDTSGGFWMKNTVLPLSIAFLRGDGSTTSTVDMEPCPASAPTCPTYPSGGTYRNAIEVPKGQLGRLGISDRSTVTIGEPSCPAR